MWNFKKLGGGSSDLPKPVAVALLLSFASLVLSAAAARWAWGVIDEQIHLRQDFQDLQNHYMQLQAQYDVWDKKTTDLRAEMHAAINKTK